MLLSRVASYHSRGCELLWPNALYRATLRTTTSCRMHKLWIDCDCGVDDAVGILQALADPATEVVGISTVFGNARVDQVARNVARVLSLADRTTVPFHVGADRSLDGTEHCPPQWYGKDGLGDRPDAAPVPASISLQPKPGHGADAIVDAARSNPGALRLVAIGPLTNVALACAKDKELLSKLESLTVMGGDESGEPEFNFASDARAAAEVLQHCSEQYRPMRMVTFDCGLRNSLPLSWMYKWLSGPSPAAHFLEAITASSRPPPQETAEKHKGQKDGQDFVCCDPITVMLGLAPQAMLASSGQICTVAQGEAPGKCSMRAIGSVKNANVELVQLLDCGVLTAQLGAVTRT